MLAFCSRLSIVSRTVNMTLQAAAGTTIQTSSCLARDLQRISPTPSVQRHCLSFLAPRRLGKTHAPSITAERRASHETNPNKSCLLDLLASDAQNGDDNPQSDLTCIGHCWKMRCCRGAWMTLWLLAQVVPASSSLLHASATCKNACLTLSARICWPCFEKKTGMWRCDAMCLVRVHLELHFQLIKASRQRLVRLAGG